jgi:hypothetical protein
MHAKQALLQSTIVSFSAGSSIHGPKYVHAIEHDVYSTHLTHIIVFLTTANVYMDSSIYLHPFTDLNMYMLLHMLCTESQYICTHIQ